MPSPEYHVPAYEPSPSVLAERIAALDRRVDERFIALDKALQLTLVNHRDSALDMRGSFSAWIAAAALLVSVLVGVLLLVKSH